MNHNEINIIYNIKDKKEIRLFGCDFVQRNKNNLKLIIDGEEQDLIDYYELKNNNKDILQIKLKGITNVTNMSSMFFYCNLLFSLPDIFKWNTSNVNNMSSMFDGCKSLSSLPNISKWNTSNVNNMSWMFRVCNSLSSLPDISKWNTSNANNMSGMFCGCKSLSLLPDISKWNTSNVNDMS